MANDAQERYRQEELARRGVSTGDYRNQNEMARIAQRESDRRAMDAATQRAMEGSTRSSSSSSQHNSTSSSSSNSGCFAAGTPVLTPRGWLAIESIRPGDTVLAVAAGTQTFAACEVLHRVVKSQVRIWEVITDAPHGPIATTAHHCFATLRGWRPVRNLIAGDKIQSADGGLATLQSVRETNRVETVYNLIAQGEFTYVVAGCVVDSLGSFRWLKALWYRLAAAFPTMNVGATSAIEGS